MGGVLIDGGWRGGSRRSVLPDPNADHPSQASRHAATRTVSTGPATSPNGDKLGELVLFPSFAHPSFGFPDFAASAPRRRSIRRRQRGRVVGVLTAGALVLGTSGILAANEIGTHSALASARAALAHTRHQLASTQAQRDSYQAQLQQAQQNLSSAQSQVNLQAGQIGVLKTCLNGVLDSLGYAANNDYTDAIATINGVSGACTSASTLVGPQTGAPAPVSTSQPPTSTV
jgi:hypothetical protein